MRISELIADLQEVLTYDGDLEVRAAMATNARVLGTTAARFSETGQYTLFLDLEGEE